MYMRGMGDIFDGGDVQLDEYIPTDSGSVSAPVASTPSGNNSAFNWDSLLQTAVKTYGTVRTIDAQTSLQQQKNALALQYPYGSTMTTNGVLRPTVPYYAPGSPPFPGAGLSGTLSAIPAPVLIMGAGLLAYAVISNRG